MYLVYAYDTSCIFQEVDRKAFKLKKERGFQFDLYVMMRFST